SISFDRIRSVLKLPPTVRFNLEDAGKKNLKDYASKSAANVGKRFGPKWQQLPLSERDLIVRKLLDESDEEALVSWLRTEYGLDEATARAVASWVPPSGTSRLGPTANAEILTELQADHLCTYSEAVRRA